MKNHDTSDGQYYEEVLFLGSKKNTTTTDDEFVFVMSRTTKAYERTLIESMRIAQKQKDIMDKTKSMTLRLPINFIARLSDLKEAFPRMKKSLIFETALKRGAVEINHLYGNKIRELLKARRIARKVSQDKQLISMIGRFTGRTVMSEIAGDYKIRRYVSTTLHDMVANIMDQTGMTKKFVIVVCLSYAFRTISKDKQKAYFQQFVDEFKTTIESEIIFVTHSKNAL